MQSDLEPEEAAAAAIVETHSGNPTQHPPSEPATIPTIQIDFALEPMDRVDPQLDDDVDSASASVFSRKLTPTSVQTTPLLHRLLAMTVEVSPEQTQMVESPVKGEESVKLEETAGIKRRKRQANKGICIPAPAAAIGRPSEEVVPSDLWAWRKYDQKPNLENLRPYQNQMTSSIPTTAASESKLLGLHLLLNYLSSIFPARLGARFPLMFVELFKKQLFDDIPRGIDVCCLLQELLLVENDFTRTLPSGLSIAEINTNDMEVCGKAIGSGTGNIFTAGVKISDLKLIAKDDPALCSQAVRCNVTEEFDPKFVISGDEANVTHEDKVKNWFTFNEPSVVAALGYDNGMFAPGRCTGCTVGGNSTTEPYIVAHNLILSHTAAVKVHPDNYQVSQKGWIGILLNFVWYKPLTSSTVDEAAAQRVRDLHIGWFLHPIMYGEYPKSVQEIVKERLPTFTKEEINIVKGSVDYVGVNQYTSYYMFDPYLPNQAPTRYQTDWNVGLAYQCDGVPIGPRAYSDWLYVVPWGMYKAVTYVKENYHSSEIGTDDEPKRAMDDGDTWKNFLSAFKIFDPGGLILMSTIPR